MKNLPLTIAVNDNNLKFFTRADFHQMGQCPIDGLGLFINRDESLYKPEWTENIILMSDFKEKFKTGIFSGAQKGIAGFIWMIEILVPVSFLTVLIEWSGLLSHMEFLLQPLMGLLYLPPAAALPIIVGMLTGIYGGIAAMAVLPFTVDQMTLIAIFILISHNLIQEGVIQGKSGLHPAKATLFRLAASVITVVAAAQFLESTSEMNAAGAAYGSGAEPLVAVLWAWLVEMLKLSLKIFAIIMGLMILMGLMKSFNMILYLVRLFNPVLKALGLNGRVGILWLTAVVFGIAYGGAVIVEEAKAGNLTPEELKRLHLSIGINHSMVEDPALFLPLGLSAFWLWIPRLITAVVAVHLLTLYARFRERQEQKHSEIQPS